MNENDKIDARSGNQVKETNSSPGLVNGPDFGPFTKTFSVIQWYLHWKKNV